MSKTAVKDRHVRPVWQSFVGPLGAHLHVMDLEELKKKKKINSIILLAVQNIGELAFSGGFIFPLQHDLLF